MDSESFQKERNEVMLSLDEAKIKAYCKKYNIAIPSKEEVFWAGVHKTITALFFMEKDTVTKEQFDNSAKWLLAHGYKIEKGDGI